MSTGQSIHTRATKPSSPGKSNHKVPRHLTESATMHSTAAASHGRRRRHRHNHFPPREYTDLSRKDIEQLTSVLAPMAALETSASASYGLNTRKSITSLPSHLRSKIPILSTFCSLHNKLNPLPIIDILNFIKHQVSPKSLADYNSTNNTIPAADSQAILLLEDINALWLLPAAFQIQYARSPTTVHYMFQPHKCAACKLAIIARSISALTALGASVIARIDPKNWKASLRIQWIEQWLKVCSPQQNATEDASVAVMAMWECGLRLREWRSPRSAEGGREYVDYFVKRARERDHRAVPVRPAREAFQDDHVEFVVNVMGQVFTSSGGAAADEATLGTSSSRRTASSLYSKTEEGEKERGSWESDNFVENDVINMYRESRFSGGRASSRRFV